MAPRHERHSRRRGERGQILAIAAIAMVAMIGGISLVLEAGNAYAHQRVAQNASDAVANAGATVLAQRLGGAIETDVEVKAATDNMAIANELDTYQAYYTNVKGKLLAPDGTLAADTSTAAAVGDGVIPAGAQGVQVGGSQTFGTTFANVLGITQFTATADATAITGALTGGKFLPVVFPVSINECDGSGTTTLTDAPWHLSNPGTPHPVGQEWIVPLCKTGGGSFMILDLDPDKNCEEEALNPSSIQFLDFPVNVDTDTGNDCPKKISDAIDLGSLSGTVVMIPICDAGPDTDFSCSTESGSGGKYHIIRIVAFFVDYISYSDSTNNAECQRTESPKYPGSSLANIVAGNGSSSCIVGWFVRYVTSGPVGTGNINYGDAIGVQLIK